MTTTETKTKNDNGLADMVKRIANQVNSGEYDNEVGGECSAFDFLCDALDIRFVVSNDLEYIGAEVLVAFGGPNIWIKTTSRKVEGFWWGDYAVSEYHEDPMGLDDALREIYESKKDGSK